MASSVKAADAIELTELETQIFETLLMSTKKAGLDTTLRCAGGWVRDKLLGKGSDDIDIALDNLMGRQFAEKVNEYLNAAGHETHSIGVIQCNPDQSKHLETARMKVCGVWLDLVNLRSETYAEGSRIPEMQFGSPEQDALRRDFTINSMFYNINTGMLEDLTQRGMQDLRDGIIRTPLEPLETFTDDPLRVLRAVRFASRFGFELDGALITAASSNKVRNELAAKVSRERVGTELDGMFHGPDPVAAARLLYQLRLFPVVFQPPQPQLELLGSNFGEPCLATMSAAATILDSPDCKVQLHGDAKRLCLFASLLLPLRDIEVPKGAVKGVKQPTSLPAFLLRESLKRKNKDGDAVTSLHKECRELLRIWKEHTGAADIPPASRTALGNAVRRLKELWEVGVVLAPLLEMEEAAPLGVDSTGSVGGAAAAPGPPTQGMAAAEAHTECVNWLRGIVYACKLDKAYSIKPMLDGKAVMAELGIQSGGPQLGKAMEKVMDWQLAYPDGTLEECKAMLRSETE